MSVHLRESFLWLILVYFLNNLFGCPYITNTINMSLFIHHPNFKVLFPFV